jgi:signal peptidase
MTTPAWAPLAARWWLAVVLSLLAWVVVPLVIGWRPVVVVSGSMTPAVAPGDVAIVDPSPAPFRVGDIVLVRTPGPAAGLLLHRIAQVRADGTLLTKGDANAAVDSTAVQVRDVEGRVRFVVPGAGQFAVLAPHPRPVGWGWTLLTALALTVTCLRPLGTRQRKPWRAVAAHR